MFKEKISELHKCHNELKTVSTSPGNNSRIILQVDGKTLRVYMMNQITSFSTDIKNFMN